MIVIAFFILGALVIVIFPMVIPYLFAAFTVLNGLASREFMNNFHATVAGANIYFPDLLFAVSMILAAIGFFKGLFTGEFRSYSRTTKVSILLTIGYFIFFLGKFFAGYIDGLPVDSLIRRFALDTQCVYMFVPLFYLKREITLRRLIYFVVVLTLILPFAQPLLYGTQDQVSLEEGQGGTLRLGFGNANLILMLGALAFFVWERKLWLSALPLAGIAMLAQRSAYISIILSIVVLSFQKKRVMKFFKVTSLAGVLLVVALMVLQVLTSVPVVSKAAERLSLTFVETSTTKSRLVVIPMALEEFGKRPWVGYSYSEEYGLAKNQYIDHFSLTCFIRTILFCHRCCAAGL